jgi:endonuclease/exonuclease/phosphatase family metal-dependent hydrolase
MARLWLAWAGSGRNCRHRTGCSIQWRFVVAGRAERVGRESRLRLLTWNANRGELAAKVEAIASLHADIAVIQEVARPPTETSGVHWFGQSRTQGVAVIVREPFKVAPLPRELAFPEFIVPFRIEGPIAFTLFAVWTRRVPLLRYVRGACVEIDRYAGLLRNGPAVLMGDFNANANWDRLHPADLNFSAMVARLHAFEIDSAYHRFHGEAYGDESRNTFFQYRRPGRGHHIDYCFVPGQWIERIQGVSIGTLESWRGWSDHCPVWVDVAV